MLGVEEGGWFINYFLELDTSEMVAIVGDIILWLPGWLFHGFLAVVRSVCQLWIRVCINTPRPFFLYFDNG